MRLNKIEKLLLVDLFKSSDGLYIYTLYQRYNLSPKELFLTIDSLNKIKLIEVDEDRLKISKQGIEFAIKNNMNSKEQTEKKIIIPENFIGPKIEINQFYIPKLNKKTNQ